jgi:hypothetical protein
MAAMTCAFALGQIVGPLTVGAAADGNGDFARPLLIAAGALVLSALALALQDFNQPAGADHDREEMERRRSRV